MGKAGAITYVGTVERLKCTMKEAYRVATNIWQRREIHEDRASSKVGEASSVQESSF